MLLVVGLYFCFAVGAVAHAAQWLARKRLSRFDTGRTGGEWAAALSERAGLRLRLEPAGNRARVKAAYLPLGRQVVLSRQVWEGQDVWAAAVAAHEVGHAVDHARGGLAGFLLAAADTGPRLLWLAGACTFVAAALPVLPAMCFFGMVLIVLVSILAGGLSGFLLAVDTRTCLVALARTCMAVVSALSSVPVVCLSGLASAVLAFALFGGLPLACLELAEEWRASCWAKGALRGGIPGGCTSALWVAPAGALGNHAMPGLLWALAAAGMAEVAAGVLWSPGVLLGLSEPVA